MRISGGLNNDRGFALDHEDEAADCTSRGDKAGVATGLTTIGLVVDPVIAGTAGLAFGAMSILRDKRKAAAQLLEKSSVSYLIVWNKI